MQRAVGDNETANVLRQVPRKADQLADPALALLRMVDPDNESGAFESFAYKQLFFEPIVGGGLFTAASPALIARFGLIGTLLITGGLLIFWLLAGIALMRQHRRIRDRDQDRQTVLH